jgi:DNA helicase-2/ATP-dependent DNA helicase PcrA
VRAAVDGLTPGQARVAEHPAGPLCVLGGAGTGKTTALVARFARLVRDGAAPEAICVLAGSPAAAAALRAEVEDALQDPYEELAVHDFYGFCARLLGEEAAEAGLDPFFSPASAADRLALLLERMDELQLRRHDLGGRPAVLLAGVIERIDRLKGQLVGADEYASWAAALAPADEAGRLSAAREQEFAQLFCDHDRLLAGQGALDAGELVARAVALLEGRPDVRHRVAERYRHVLVDGYADLDLAPARLLELLAAEHASITVTVADDEASRRFRAAATRNLANFRTTWSAHAAGYAEVVLEDSLRCPQRILEAAQAVVAPIADRLGLAPAGAPGGSVRFWRAGSERAQAQGTAAEIEHLVREGAEPGRIAIFVRSLREEGRDVALALEERAIPYRLVGGADFFAQAEVRDVLAWLRLLADPSDAGAVVRALARPPIELRSVDLARCVQIARRRKLDMVSALGAATESPQIPPEARERILAFLKIYRGASGALDTTRPDLFVHRLIERLGLRRQQVFAAHPDVVERLVALARLGELAGAYARRAPHATPRDFARYAAAVAEAGLRDAGEDPVPAGSVRVLELHSAAEREFDWAFVLGLRSARMPGARRRAAEPIPDALLKEDLGPEDRVAHQAAMRRVLHTAITRAREGVVLAFPARSDGGALQPPSPFVEEARAALGGAWEDVGEELFGPEEALHATYQALRDELLSDVARVGKGLGELRLDTDLDVTHAVTRYLELLKVAALLERPPGQPIADALAQVNQRLAVGISPQQREVLVTSGLDDVLMAAERDDRARAAARAARSEPSLEAFLPRRGDGLLLSASDIETYRTCPLKYKFARVFRVPQEPTLNQRFGILVHQVLERYHQSPATAGGNGASIDELLGLLEQGWRRGGFGASDQERQLHEKASSALQRYHARISDEPVEPVWFERAFSFRMGPHTLRGRVDRVDRLPGGGYELIDYKTGRPRPARALREDVQLSLYAIGAREAWELEAADQAYLYVLDDEKVRVPSEAMDPAWIEDTVAEVAAGIQAQDFEPTPSYAACSMCDYRIACPAAER